MTEEKSMSTKDSFRMHYIEEGISKLKGSNNSESALIEKSNIISGILSCMSLDFTNQLFYHYVKEDNEELRKKVELYTFVSNLCILERLRSVVIDKYLTNEQYIFLKSNILSYATEKYSLNAEELFEELYEDYLSYPIYSLMFKPLNIGNNAVGARFLDKIADLIGYNKEYIMALELLMYPNFMFQNHRMHFVFSTLLQVV